MFEFGGLRRILNPYCEKKLVFYQSCTNDIMAPQAHLKNLATTYFQKAKHACLGSLGLFLCNTASKPCPAFGPVITHYTHTNIPDISESRWNETSRHNCRL